MKHSFVYTNSLTVNQINMFMEGFTLSSLKTFSSGFNTLNRKV